eukprot:4265816-Amphidinium_carterae.1
MLGRRVQPSLGEAQQGHSKLQFKVHGVIWNAVAPLVSSSTAITCDSSPMFILQLWPKTKDAAPACGQNKGRGGGPSSPDQGAGKNGGQDPAGNNLCRCVDWERHSTPKELLGV